MTDTRLISFTLNGKPIECDAPVRLHLGDLLREQLGLTGTHLACEHGVCGACTVVVDGEAIRSCLMLGVQANGRDVVTVEGLADPGGGLHVLQQAFAEKHGLQCGYCTPGMLTSLAVFLSENDDPSEDEVREAISGNICRCTGYQPIVQAALLAARRMRENKGN